MTPTIATLAIATLGAGLAYGAYSRRKADKAMKQDPKPALTNKVAHSDLGEKSPPTASEHIG